MFSKSVILMMNLFVFRDFPSKVKKTFRKSCLNNCTCVNFSSRYASYELVM